MATKVDVAVIFKDVMKYESSSTPVYCIINISNMIHCCCLYFTGSNFAMDWTVRFYLPTHLLCLSIYPLVYITVYPNKIMFVFLPICL